MTIRALVFDFDGLILDTETPIYDAVQEMYAAHGHALALETWQAIIGTTDGFDPVEDLERLVGRTLDRAALERATERRVDELLAGAPLMPGVEELIAEAGARGIPLGIASSSSSRWVESLLERHGILEAFACIRCRDHVGTAKPDPASYRAVVEALGVAPREALALEDSAHGVAAAKAAGLVCVAVPGAMTRGLRFDAADAVVDSLRDLTVDRLLALGD